MLWTGRWAAMMNSSLMHIHTLSIHTCTHKIDCFIYSSNYGSFELKQMTVHVHASYAVFRDNEYVSTRTT